jgi:hypothetical protein
MAEGSGFNGSFIGALLGTIAGAFLLKFLTGKKLVNVDSDKKEKRENANTDET